MDKIETSRISYLRSQLHSCYGVKSARIEPNIDAGCLGETYIIDDQLVLKIPRRGGLPAQPQGNVRFSTYVMNEAKLHGLPSPWNIATRSGLPYAYDSMELGHFHLMEKMPTVELKHIPNDPAGIKELAFCLGLHAARITIRTSRLLYYLSLPDTEYADHWSAGSLVKKLRHSFGFGSADSRAACAEILRRCADQLHRLDHVPKTLVEQAERLEPLEMIEIAEGLSQSRCGSRSIVHNDIKPGNLSIVRDGGSLRVVGSFDYTMCCLGNPAKNIAYTAVDSGIGTNPIDYGSIGSIAAGVMSGCRLTEDDLYLVEDLMIEACLKKYALRWEYWQDELRGSKRDFEMGFLDPREFYELTMSLLGAFAVSSLNHHLLKAFHDMQDYQMALTEVERFLLSDLYKETRVAGSYSNIAKVLDDLDKVNGSLISNAETGK